MTDDEYNELMHLRKRVRQLTAQIQDLEANLKPDPTIELGDKVIATSPTGKTIKGKVIDLDTGGGGFATIKTALDIKCMRMLKYCKKDNS